MKAIRGVILDVDGTLVDSNDAHARAWVEAFARHGIEIDLAAARRRIGKGGDKLMPEVSGIEEESETGKKISDERAAIFKRDYLPRLQAFPGVRELLRRMRDDGLKLVVASSAKEDELKPLLELAGAAGLIEEQTSSDDAGESKPDPDIVRAALHASGLAADEVVMIGDTPYDVEAARRAGIATIAFRCGGWDDEALAGALAIYDGPEDLLRRYDQSPLAPRRGADVEH